MSWNPSLPITVSASTYPDLSAPSVVCGTGPDAIGLPTMRPDFWYFNVQSTATPGDDIWVSFDGKNDHLLLTAGSVAAQSGVKVPTRSSKVWLRRAAGDTDTIVYAMAGTHAGQDAPMSRTLIKNTGTTELFTLPYPYAGVLSPGQGGVTADDLATVVANLDLPVGTPILVQACPDGDTEPVTIAAFPSPTDQGAATVGNATAASGTGATGAAAPAFTGAAPAFTGAAPAFTGAAPAVAEVAAFTGTGFATAGQVVTTTDTQNMTLNQCAGMWLITASQPPCLILSNTAVVLAPAVLTVYGLAPTTNAETYKILTAPTPAGTVAAVTGTVAAVTGTVASHTHTGPSHTHVET